MGLDQSTLQQLQQKVLDAQYHPLQPSLLQPNPLQQQQLKKNGAIQILKILYAQWRGAIIATKIDLRECSDGLSNFQENEKLLHVTLSFEPLKVELGDRVKIIMKARQLKQFNKGGWNDLIKNDIGGIGNVIGILAPDGSDVVIYFPKSGQKWTISVHALKKIDEIEGDQQRLTTPCTDLKIGDDVMILERVPEYVITTMQNIVAFSARAVLDYRHSLLKLISFIGQDVAIVSIDRYKSIMLHVGLLSKKPETPGITLPPSDKSGHPKKSIPKRFSIGEQYLVKSSIETLITMPHWTYLHTKIIDKPGTICYHGQNGEIGFKVDGEGFFITTDYLGRQLKKGRRRNKTGEHEPYNLSPLFPFPVGEAVKFDIGDTESCERMLKDLSIPLSFLEVVQNECATFLGYDSPGRAQIEFQSPFNITTWQNFTVSTSVVFLKRGSRAECQVHKEMRRRFRSIKVNDTVSLKGAKYCQFVSEELGLLSATEDVKHAMTSNATLVAFDDDNDRAVLKYGNEKVFSCSSIYINAQCPGQAPPAFGGLPSASTSSTARVIEPGDEGLEPGNGCTGEKDHAEVARDVSVDDDASEDDQDDTARPSQPPSFSVQETSPNVDSTNVDEEEDSAPPTSSGAFSASLNLPPRPSVAPPTSPMSAPQSPPITAGTLEAPAKIRYNPVTHELVVWGLLGGRNAQLAAGQVPLQTTTVSASGDRNETPSIVGDTFNLNNCRFNGPVYMGTGTSASIDPSDQ